MPITPRAASLRHLRRLFAIATEADRRGIPSAEAVELARRGPTRRRFLGGAAAAAALTATGVGRARAAAAPSVDVAIVGAGLAGLQCAHELAAAGVTATIYEASDRVGGRQRSIRGVFPGQVAEAGGELIDNLHKTMLGWVGRLGLTREDVTRTTGELFYYFGGRRVAEATIVDEYRAFVAAMRPDLRASSGSPTATASNAADRALDALSLRDYLVSRGCGSNARAAIEEAYVAEYGREPTEQSSLGFLLFIHADRRSKFTPFGVFSDERFHVVEGNDAIASGIAATLPRPPTLGHALVALRLTAAGRVELTLRVGNRTVVRTHDRVVLAVPFTVLRTVAIDASVGLPPWKRLAIDQLGYGDNAKMMIGFAGPVWAAAGGDGGIYSDLPNLQTTWETSPSTATSSRAVLTDYSGGARGKALDPGRVQTEAGRFLTDLDRIVPGAAAAAVRGPGGRVLAELHHWPSNPLARGSYTCYRPGQFTTIAGNEGPAVGPVHFAGEHTNSFYEWQGFMEGALLSGITAAAEILGG